MKKAFKIAILGLSILGMLAFCVFYVGSLPVAVLEPKGIVGEKEKELIITASLLMLIVVVPVLILTWIFVWKYREGNRRSKHTPDWGDHFIAECCWWGIPLVIIVILSVITWKSTHDLNPFKPLKSDKHPIHIQVVALQWKWLFIYPELGIATVNFIQFPQKTPVNFEITADAPMNSLWIPELGGQIYAMAGMRSTLHLMADGEGSYRGVSANISGTGFAGMVFTAQSSSDQAFASWVESIKHSAKPLTWDRYTELVEPTENNPVTYYLLTQEDLFDQIMMKYMKGTHARKTDA